MAGQDPRGPLRRPSDLRHGWPFPGALRFRGFRGAGRLWSLRQALRARRRPPLRYLLLGGCCCAVELAPLALDRYRPDHLGIQPARSAADAEVLVVAGPVTEKNAPIISQVYRSMAEPRWVIALSGCSCGGGPYHQGATVLDGVDTVIPVDVYVPGSPPRPEALIHALLQVQDLKRLGSHPRSIDVTPYG